MLVEDSLIITMDAEDLLIQMGAARVVTAATIVQALEQISRERLSLAVLDFNLGHENSLPIADRLKAEGVPFLFATGYGEQLRLPAAHVGTAVIQKPYTLNGLAKLRDLLRK